MPFYFNEIIEQIGFEARMSEFVDQKSGVSARLTISAIENFISNAERRAILLREPTIIPRFLLTTLDIACNNRKSRTCLEGEQEGSVKIGKALIGKAVRFIFREIFSQSSAAQTKSGKQIDGLEEDKSDYNPILHWFGSGNKIEIADDMPFDNYRN